MSGRAPDEIWEEGLDEGQRRLERGLPALAATGFAGGADVFFGILVVAVTTGALQASLPEPTAHILASLTFGFGLAFITIGRAELFTENFLIPVGAVVSGRAPVSVLLRMWVITLVLNFAGLALFAAVVTVDGVLETASLDAAGALADTVGGRDSLPSFMSAVIAGTIMTLFTWVAAAAEGSAGRIVASLIAGFILIAPSLNHAVVAFGEMVFGLFADTATISWGDALRTVGIAIAGNAVGGIGLVFSTRLAQVRGEPGSESGAVDTRA